MYSGEVLCILGPNGAGKSTTINILTAALESDGGEISYKGSPIGRQLRKHKQSLGIVPQDIALYEELSAERNLSFFASLYGLHGAELKKAVDKALVFAGLEDRRHGKITCAQYLWKAWSFIPDTGGAGRPDKRPH